MTSPSDSAPAGALRDCPFCGGYPTTGEFSNKTPAVWCSRENGCGIGGKVMTVIEWNHRATYRHGDAMTTNEAATDTGMLPSALVETCEAWLRGDIGSAQFYSELRNAWNTRPSPVRESAPVARGDGLPPMPHPVVESVGVYKELFSVDQMKTYAIAAAQSAASPVAPAREAK